MEKTQDELFDEINDLLAKMKENSSESKDFGFEKKVNDVLSQSNEILNALSQQTDDLADNPK